MDYDIFVSYANGDKAFVDALVHSLEASNIRCWYAPRDIPTGMEWPAAIPPAIKDSSLMLLVFSKNSNTSQEVAKELTVASNSKRLVVPVNLDRTPLNAQMEYHLSNRHWLDIYDLETEVAIHRVQECLRQYEHLFKDSKLESTSVPVESRKASPEPRKALFGITRNPLLKPLLVCACLLLVVGGFLWGRASKPTPQPSAATQPAVQTDSASRPQNHDPDAEYAHAVELVNKKSYEDGLKQLEKLAQTANPKAEQLLGDLYYSGLGVKADKGKAAALYQRAANHGSSEAQYSLACMYEQGAGVEQNSEKARELFRNAAEKGHGEAMYSLGELYEYGTGIPANFEQGFSWFFKAAQAGVVAAQFKIGTMYYQGVGVRQNQAEGLNWLYKAADAGDEQAKAFLANR